MADDTSGSQPSEQRIREELAAAKDMWAETMEDKAKLQEMYRRKYPVAYLEGNPLIKPVEYRSGDYDENIDRISGLINIPPRYSVTAKGLGPRPKEHGEKIEGWDNNILDEIEFYQGQNFRNAISHEVPNFGFTAVSILPDGAAYDKYPHYDGDYKEYNKLVEKFGQLAPPPIKIFHIPVLTWRPLLSGRIVLKSFQTQMVRAAAIRFQYPELVLPDRETLKDTDTVEYVTYIDDTWCVYLVQQGSGGNYTLAETARAWRHHMNFDGSLKGRAPVVLFQGITTGDTELPGRWKGYGESIIDTIKAEDMIISSQLTRSLMGASPTFIAKIDPAITPANQAMLNSLQPFQIGGANMVVPGMEWVEYKFGDMPIVQEYVWKKLQAIQDSRFPQALKGNIEAGTSGFLYNMATEHAKLILKPGVNNIAQSWVDTMRMIHLALGALEDMAGKPMNVPVRKKTDNATEAITLNYADVVDYGGLLDATLEAEMVYDEQANLDAVSKAVNLGLPLRDSLQRYGRRENAQELVDQAAAEAIENEPAFLAMRRQDILRRMGVLRNKKEGITPEEVAAMAPLSPALQRLLLVMQGAQIPPEGAVGPMEGGMVGPTMLPGGIGAAPPIPPPPPVMPPPVMPPPMTPAPVMGAKGVAVKGKAPPRVNPRAGQRSQPGGPRRRTGSVQLGGRT